MSGRRVNTLRRTLAPERLLPLPPNFHRWRRRHFMKRAEGIAGCVHAPAESKRPMGPLSTAMTKLNIHG
jgi:hypothetical protein